MELILPFPRPSMVAAPEGEMSESPQASTPLSLIPSPAALFTATPPRVSQAFVAPVPAAPVHAHRIVKRPKAHDRATSVSSASSSSAGSSAEEQVAPTVPPAPIHKLILTDVRHPPPGLTSAGPKANMFCKPERGVQPTMSMQCKLTNVLSLHTKAAEPPRSPLRHISRPAEAINPPSRTLESRSLKPTALSLS
ncbi:hypothetical protein BDR07DRAFT_1074143 [Suillus spraguei]|nr:hypothetical protein BDR07DRAFT_1074143 [Suillus spraguei]